MTLISKVTKPLSETGYMPLEDVIIPNFPKLPSHNHSCLREEVQTTSINSLQDPVFYSKVEVPIKMDFAPAFLENGHVKKNAPPFALSQCHT
jgi:hypothetical protein